MTPSFALSLELLLSMLVSDALGEVGTGRVRGFGGARVVEVLEPVVETVVSVLREQQKMS